MMKYLPAAVVGTGVLVIAASFGSAYVMPKSERAVPEPAAAPALPEPAAKLDLAASAGLFGATAARTPATIAPQTPLPDMHLAGVLLAEDIRMSQAMIRTEGKVGFFRLGDVIALDFKLAQIDAGQITLSNGAQEHVLQFEDLSDQAGRSADALRGAQSYRTPAHRAMSAELKPPETTQDYIAYWRERLRRNPGEVLDEIGLIPGESGYTIAKKQNIGVRLAGFRTGDLITSVNGHPVGNADKDRKTVDTILAAGVAQITFERNGEQRVFSFPLK